MGKYLQKLKTRKQATGVLPKPPKGKKTEKTFYPGTAKTAKRPFDSKDSTQVRHFSGNKIQQERQELWNRADALADWIDNPDSDVPSQKRATKVPELQKMSARIGELDLILVERKRYADNRLNGKKVVQNVPDNEPCPAQCKRTGKCYGYAWFNGKPGKPTPCTPDQCAWREHLKDILI